MPVTLEQVAAAAQQISRGGGKPTSRAVREKLGTGSLATIQKYLGQYLGTHRNEVTDGALPKELQRAIADYLDREIARARAEIKAEFAEQIAELKRQLREARRKG